MGLRDALASFGRGVQRAAPYVQRGAAAVASAYGNDKPAEDLKAQDAQNWNRAITMLGISRQQAQDELANQEAHRQQGQFDTNQETAHLNQDVLRRQLAQAPNYNSPEEKQAADDAHSLGMKRQEEQIQTDAEATRGRTKSIQEGNLPYNVQVPVPPATINYPPDLNFGQQRTFQMPPASDERFAKPLTTSGVPKTFPDALLNGTPEQKKAAREGIHLQGEAAQGRFDTTDKRLKDQFDEGQKDKDATRVSAARKSAIEEVDKSMQGQLLGLRASTDKDAQAQLEALYDAATKRHLEVPYEAAGNLAPSFAPTSAPTPSPSTGAARNPFRH